MIKIKMPERDYYRCHSCHASKIEHGSVVFSISIGLNDLDTNTIRLCMDCMADLESQVRHFTKAQFENKTK